MLLKTIQSSLVLALAAISVVGVTAGCNSSAAAPESIASPERVTQIVEMRKIFDEAKGNWDTMPAEAKANYIKMAGDEAKAKQMWDKMAHPGPSVPTGQAPTGPQ